MIATSDDVAQRAGVSRATVSQVLNGRGQRFSTETIERVQRAAKELDYQPSAAGRALARGASDFVVALVPNTTFGGNLQDIFEIVTAELAAHGFTLVLHFSTPATGSLDRLVASTKPAAVVSLTPFTAAERAVLTRRTVPAFDADGAAARFDVEIGRLQARHLAERGYRRLAFAHLHDARQDPFGAGREQGVIEASRELGRPEPTVVRLGVDIDQAQTALDQLGRDRIGVACYNDDVATALLSAARRAGRTVPDEIGLIGMDNTALSRVCLPRLTTVAYDVVAVGRSAAATVLNGLGLAPAPPQPRGFWVEPGGTT